MRICSILTSFGSGGAETLVINLSREYVAAGHDAQVLVLSDADAIGASVEFERFRKSEISGSGAVPISLALKNRRNLLAGSLAMRRTLKTLQPDIVHAHTAQALIYLLFSGYGGPVLYTHHNMRLSFPSWLFRLFDRLVCAYVAIGPQCRDLLDQHTKRPIVDIVNGVPTNFAKPRSQSQVGNDPTILSVGLLSEQKNYPLLVEAAKTVVAQMVARGRKPKFLIAGGGAAIGDMNQLAKAHGVNEYVEFLGTRDDIPDLMAKADILVNCSLWEGLPITLIEAAMSGLPMVATDVGGNGEIVVDGFNGRLIAPANANQLARAILEVTDLEYDYARASTNSVEQGKKFTIESCAKAHLALYDQQLNDG